jgi:ATP-dependent Clp protease ATP-binding subunit ClpA/ATP-dependent Clp protease ATP-binding subunit ClpC
MSRVSFTVGVLVQRKGADQHWTPLIPSEHQFTIVGQSEARLRDNLVDRLRRVLDKTDPIDQDLFQLHVGARLRAVHVDVGAKIGGVTRRVEGSFPVLIEPRWLDDEIQRLHVWHPFHPEAFLIADYDSEIDELAPHLARKMWTPLVDHEVERMKSTGRERLIQISFSAEPRSLLDQIAAKKDKGRQRAGVARSRSRVLPQLGVDQTSRAVDGTLPLGVPREPYRSILMRLLGGDRPRSTIVVGPAGAGKQTLVHRWIADRLEADGYPIHRNLDSVRRVWRLSGKRIIAGMSHLGDWEDRMLDVAFQARVDQAILWFEDLHLFGRLGQSRQSERSLADFLRGPVQRGEMIVVASLTREQLARLEDDAPSLAGLFVRVPVPAASAQETSALLLHEVRELEQRAPIEIHPFVPRTAIELGGALLAWTALPGAAIDLVRKVADAEARTAPVRTLVTGASGVEVGPDHVVRQLSRQTGLPEALITLDRPLDPADVRAAFERRVMGQPEAIARATDIVMSVRAGLTDPARPLAVELFTGPTGTGKTELALTLAEYLYGDPKRLVRLDMSELSGPEAVARLIGDRWNPRGLLTERIREQPFSLVLLDEIEKAHPAVLALLLQLFDEGRLTDAAGDTASFVGAVIVMTSNLGARPQQPIGFGDQTAAVLAEIARAVREFFPPELWNRIDHVVPFRPLTPEVAERIVDKELARLLARRGLRERSVLVYAGAAVRARAVAEAFDPRWGARTVKRWLEDHIATLLADELGKGEAARMRVARLFELPATGAIGVEVEPLVEASPADGPFALEPLLDVPALALAPDAARTAALLVAPSVRERLAAVEARARAGGQWSELAFYVDNAGERLGQLVARLGGRMPPVSPKPPVSTESSDGGDAVVHDDLERAAWTHDEIVVNPGNWSHTYRLRRHGKTAAHRRRPLDRDQALTDIASARLVLANLDRIDDAAAHAATVIVSRIGHGREDRGASAVPGRLDPVGLIIPAIARKGWVDAAAVRLRGGRTQRHTGDAGATLAAALAGDAEVIVVVLRDLLVHAAVAGEHGCHVVQSLTGEPDLIRVEVRAGAADADAVLEAHLAARAAFDEATRAGRPLPPNPDRLLPVARVLSYRSPLRPGESFRVELEDFTTGWVATVDMSSIAAVVMRAMELRWSAGGAA